jgi:hypothetical protein
MFPTTRVAIRLDARAPLRGVVESGAGQASVPFVGWLGLLRVLEETLEPHERSLEER